MKNFRMNIAVALVLAAAGPVMAGTFHNPGFETGNMDGWRYGAPGGFLGGSVEALQNSDYGNWQAYEGDWFCQLKTDARGSNKWSYLAQYVQCEQGDRIGFRYFWKDRSWTGRANGGITLVGHPGVTIEILDLNGESNTPNGTWLQAVSAPVPTSGLYEVQVGIRNGRSWKHSVLGLDEFEKKPATAVVPEPMTASAVIIGLASLAGYLQRRRSAQQQDKRV